MQISVSSIERCGRSSIGREFKTPERLCAWSFMVAVSAGLRWKDLLNSAPSTLVLMNEGLMWFAAKTATRESRKEDHGVGLLILTLKKTKDGYKRAMDCLRMSQGVTIGISGSANHWGLIIKVSTRPPRVLVLCK